MSGHDEGAGTFPWMDERRALFARHAGRAADRPRAAGDLRMRLSQARDQVRACEARPEIMRAWASAPLGGEIPDEEWDLITDFHAYLWVKTGCSMDALDAIGGTMRRLASGQIDGSDPDALTACLLADPRILDDRRRAGPAR